MNKSEIVGRVADRMGLSKPAAEGAVGTVFAAIGEALAKGEDVRIAGFGTFATRTRRARTGRNPRTGESVSIPASKTPSFKAGKALKETVNRGWESTSGEREDGERPRRERMVVQSVARDAVRARGARQRGPGEAGVRLVLSDWPGGVAPVWAMLDPESAQALRDEPSEGNRALRLASDLTEEEFGQSAFVRNALVLLEGMAVAQWLWLTDKGNFQRATVAAMRASMFWPGMEAAEQFRADKALREEDVGELHLLHRLAHMAGLVEGDAAMLRLTSLGRDMLEAGRRSGLQALLFRHAFWHMDLSRFVSGLPRGLPGRWPQGDDIGQLLWCLSAVGSDWQSADTLAALCAVPDDTLPTAHWNPVAWMFAGRILGPLRWFGLVEWREPQEIFEARCWRKTALFDRFVSFDVRLTDARPAGH